MKLIKYDYSDYYIFQKKKITEDNKEHIYYAIKYAKYFLGIKYYVFYIDKYDCCDIVWFKSKEELMRKYNIFLSFETKKETIIKLKR